MEQRTKCPLPAPTESSDRLIDLVDRVMKRHPGKAKPRRKLFSFLMRARPLVRPSLGRPSQKIAVPAWDLDLKVPLPGSSPRRVA